MAMRPENIRAVLIGIGQFDEYRTLYRPVNDAIAMYIALTHPLFGGVPPANVALLLGGEPYVPDLEDAPRSTRVRLLVEALQTTFNFQAPPGVSQDILDQFTDEKFTRTQILRKIAAAARNAGPDDVVLIYYSGHGELASEDLCLLAQDSSRPPSSVDAVSFDDLKKTLVGQDPMAVAVILDTCRSGQAVETEATDEQRASILRPPHAFSRLATVASSSPDENAYELPPKTYPEYQNSLFTHFFLAQLFSKRTDPSPPITLRDAFASARQEVIDFINTWQPTSVFGVRIAQEPRANQPVQTLGSKITLVPGTGMQSESTVAKLVELSLHGRAADVEIELDQFLQESFPKVGDLQEAEDELRGDGLDPKRDARLMAGLNFLLLGRDHPRAARGCADLVDSEAASPTARLGPGHSADAHLQPELVQTYIFDKYGIQDSNFRNHKLCLYELGTTSYILAMYRPENYAAMHWGGVAKEPDLILKIIRPRYWSSGTITEKTSKYQSLLDHLLQKTDNGSCHGQPDHSAQGITRNYQISTPVVHDSQKLFIVMDFAPGEKLRRYIENLYSRVRADSPDFLRSVREIVVQLCQILQTCSKSGLWHGDLSPDNVLVEESEGGALRVRLIDFGVNYIVIERTASAAVIGPMLRNIAPELLQHPGEDSPPSDVYGMGVLLLEMLSNARMEVASIQDALDELQSRYPRVGFLVEAMLDRDPISRSRAFQQRTTDPDALYGNLGRILGEALDIYTELNRRTPVTLGAGATLMAENLAVPPTRWRGILTPLLAGLRARELVQTSRLLRPSDPKAAARGLVTVIAAAPGALVALLVGLVVLSPDRLQILVTEVDILKRQKRWDELARAQRLLDFCRIVLLVHLLIVVLTLSAFGRSILAGKLDEIAIYGPGWLVGFSFSFVGTMFYMNINSTLSPGRFAPGAEAVLRSLTFIPFIPILLGYSIDDTLWPIWAWLGILPIALSNRLVSSYCRSVESRLEALRVASESRLDIHPPPRVKRAEVEFRAWWWMIGGYAGTLLLVGVLLKWPLQLGFWPWQIGIIDPWPLALITVLINMKMGTFECDMHATKIRDTIAWYIANDERTRKYEDYSVAVSPTPVATRTVLEAIVTTEVSRDEFVGT